MKTIRIKHFCRLPLWFTSVLAVAVPLCTVCFAYGVVKGVPELTAIGALELAVFTVGFGFYFNYGIAISKK